MTNAVIQSINHIAINPKVRSGRPYILGTTITVADVAIARIFHMRTPDEIAGDYALSLSQVHAALAYYYEHQAEMDAQIHAWIHRVENLAEKRVGNEGSLLSR